MTRDEIEAGRTPAGGFPYYILTPPTETTDYLETEKNCECCCRPHVMEIKEKINDMTPSSDLVKRLRDYMTFHVETGKEAADRIEALERQCRASETPLVSGEAEGPARFWRQKCSAYAALREVDLARIEALEAENARLKLILGNFMYAYGPHENLGGLPGVKQIWTDARAALGEKP